MLGLARQTVVEVAGDRILARRSYRSGRRRRSVARPRPSSRISHKPWVFATIGVGLAIFGWVQAACVNLRVVSTWPRRRRNHGSRVLVFTT